MAAALLCFCAMVTCALWAVVIGLNRVEQVNARLPAEEKIGFTFGFIGPERHWRFEKEYERLFPDRALRRKERTLWALAALAVIGLSTLGGKFISRPWPRFLFASISATLHKSWLHCST
jgi:hypothetical protein